MSRLEKNKERKNKREKLRRMSNILFMIGMVTITSVCLIIVDKNVNTMLGNESRIENREQSLKELQSYVENKLTGLKIFKKTNLK